jgi:hypothetical protein
MATNVSPGVYTKIIDLSAFVQAAPATIGFITSITEKGEDNVLKFVGSRSDLISEFGEPNITTYGKSYGQGLYCAYNFLGESGALYFLRVLPDDAAFANMRIDALFGTTDTSASFQVTSISAINTKAELKTNLADIPPTQHPLCFLYPIGRGQYYNKLSLRLTEVANPLLDGVYVLDLYEKQSDGDDVIIESFQVSFDPTSRDLAGDSLFIGDVLAMYSSVLRAEMQLTNEAYSPGYFKVIHIYDKNIGSVTADIGSGTAQITDNKQDFSTWDKQPETGYANYVVIAKDAKGVEIWGWLGSSTGYADNAGCNVFNIRDLSTATQAWNGNTTDFDVNSEIVYTIKEAYGSVADAFTSAEPVPLKRGSDGSLLDSVGNLDPSEATTLLAQGYAGIIDDTVLDTENIYYTLVFDCGYPTDVKTQISTLVQTRRDCVGILDNGDNSSVNNALAKRNTDHTFNTFYLAMYECYNKVFDAFTGQDVWFSPIYHISYLAPRNDSVAEPWFAIAGYNRAAIDTIKDLRFNPRLGQRDQLYRKQLNPIVKFNPGYVVWGQLTTQAKPSALQDLNIVRLVLYVKRAFEDFCKFFIFEQNDEITWGQVSAQLVAFLENIKSRRGLYSYSVEVGASDYEKKTKKFHINIILQPTRVVEQIELNFYIQ